MAARRNKRRPDHRWRRRGIVLVAMLVAVSVVQYRETGTITWPTTVYERITGAVSDYTGRPEAGWRRAADTIEDIGAAREGAAPGRFDIQGRVVRVADGDTVSVLDHNKQQHKVRLFGIDTPEWDQPHGKQARAALDAMVDGKQVGVVQVQVDSYGRTVGVLYQGDNNINLAMIHAGHAWWYRYYAPSERRFEQAERQARDQGIGLWSKANPIPPWDWRRGQR